MTLKWRRRDSFDFNWKFFKGDVAEAKNADFDDSKWRSVDLPHDWSIEGPFSQDNPAGGGGAYLPGGVGWYRKRFKLSEQYLVKKIFIEFDGIYKNSDVWVNNHHLGFHPYGYTSFYYDMTPYLNYGDKENILAVRVDNSRQPDARWYTGSGIYRHVWITITDKLHVAQWGTYITTPKISEDFARVVIRTRVVNEYDDEKQCTLTTSIIDQDGNEISTNETQHSIIAHQEHEFIQTFNVQKPHLWSIENPYLYKAYNTLRVGKEPVDDYETTFGIRSILFDADKGFLLNGRQVKIKGVCLHHDGGCVGAAVPEAVLERRLKILKEMGCNAIRCSHYPPAPELLDMCDRMGFLVMDEAFDEWRIGKFKYGYHDYFDEWAIKDLESMIYRDRNHPCIIIWSVGNEIPEQTILPDGPIILKKLVDTVHRLDPTRPVTAACDNIGAEPPTTIEFLELLDVVGYNYVDRWGERKELMYSIDRHLFPKRKMIGTEVSSIMEVRDEYVLEGPKGYISNMIDAEEIWRFTRIHDYVSGMFIWAGIEYLGESRWPYISFVGAPIDRCGFKKDSFYFYKSQWTEEPVLYIFPHWNWKGKEGHVIPVICYTNCDEVELFLNGKSYGKQRYQFPRQGMDPNKGWFWYVKHGFPIPPTTVDLHLLWFVPYEPGTLMAIGRKGDKIVIYKRITTGEPAKIGLEIDKETVIADGRDCFHLTAKILDKDGNIVPTADNMLTFHVEGEGKIIGVDNGDPASHEPFKTNQRRAFHGLCLAIIQATNNPGKITVRVISPNLEPAEITVKSIKP
ncbi:MAG: glycoside hydrolase family 2 TIM barrel-domain containing protein [Candidatus Bathyarchaeia archaeon]